MSAPDTNVEKQKRKHKASLVGIAVAVILGGALALYYGSNRDAVEETAETMDQAVFYGFNDQ